MNNLLDTHTFLWFINGSSEISLKAISAIESKQDGNYVSIATLWEIAIKKSINKLDLVFSFDDLLTQINKNNFKILQPSFQDTKLISTLPLHHNDPFDRILIAQAITNNLTIITKDIHFKNYNVNLIW